MRNCHPRSCLQLAFAAMLFALPATNPAFSQVFDELVLIRGVERVDSLPDGPTPYSFEACIAGPDISTTTLPTLQTPVSTNFPSGSLQSMSPRDGEFCFSGTYSSLSDLTDDFPNGAYVITATNVAGDVTDSKQVDLLEADVGAYSDIRQPLAGGFVSLTSPTTIGWDLVDIGGCDTNTPATCLDFYWIYAVLDDPGFPEDEVYVEYIGDPATTSTSVPAATFLPGVGYRIEVQNRRGAVGTESTDILETSVMVYRGTADTNATTVTGATASVPISDWGRSVLILLLVLIGAAATRLEVARIR